MAIQEDKVNESNENVNANTKKGVVYAPYILAAGVLVAYGFFIYYLIGKVGVKDPDWSRLIYLFSGVEAIVFAAAGFLFGKEVNRKRAEQAEIEKDHAKKQAVGEHNKGLILAAMAVQGETTSRDTSLKDATLESEFGKSPMASIAEKARKMYPELDNL